MTDETASITAAVNGTFVAQPSPAVAAVRADDEMVLLHEPTGHLHLLNPTGALLWECLDGTSRLTDICADVAEVVGVPFELALRDAVSLVAELAARGLVTDSAAAPAEPAATDEPAADGLRLLPVPPDT